MSTILKSTSTVGMVLIPAGSFLMGDAHGGEFERPVHEVWLDDYWIDETPVTNAQFRDFVEATGHVTLAEKVGSAWGHDGRDFANIVGLSWRSYAEDRDDHPVVLVSFDDASAFAAWAGKRLPTEAEWEKATRGGLIGKLYPWGDDEVDGSQCNFARRFEGGMVPTTPVRAFAPNGLGLYDSVGNVWQWCQDWFQEDTYAASTSANPTGPGEGTHKVRRGGSWNVIQPFRLRCANRGAFAPEQVAANVGFRCAK
ncbi:MAG: formylglycine-generating enzyme family protein [Planctomycetaceae bacterium]|nr:formylglycine-generating enzyme family protein [Planctomycetaceae bacterium]